MNFKNKWKRFWTLERHANGGFTLVELVVVIAILGILAGAGTAGYAGYVKQANKKADLTTVGNIERALEVGVYSQSFKLPEALQIGSNGVTYPVGFVVLTGENDGGVQLFSTGSTYCTGTQTNACKLETIKIRPVLAKTKVYAAKEQLIVGGYKSETVYTLGEYQEHTYCSTHTNLPEKRNVVTAAEPNGRNVKITASVTDYIGEDFVGVYALAEGHTDGEYRETTVITDSGSTGVNNTVLQDALTAAYGSAWDGVALKYDGWTSGDIATFCSDAPDILDSVTTMGDKALGALDNRMVQAAVAAAGIELFSKDYESSDDMVISFAQALTSRMTEEQWVSKWKAVDNSGDADSFYYDSYDFGLTEREFFYAARVAYNSNFASYLKNSTTCANATAHATAIEGYYKGSDGDSSIQGIMNAVMNVSGLGIPGTVCRSAFKVSDSGLAEEVRACTDCYNLYGEYVSSGTSEANARALYNTMLTISQTVGEIDKTELGKDELLGYYTDYLNEFSELYTNVQTMTEGKSAIVITVYYKDGALSYEVSPQEANPRNDD